MTIPIIGKIVEDKVLGNRVIFQHKWQCSVCKSVLGEEYQECSMCKNLKKPKIKKKQNTYHYPYQK